jgi:hypothetical protein
LGDALAGEVHFTDGDLHFLADFDDFVRVYAELAGELADVDECALSLSEASL